MALEITNLQEKLNGKLPINRSELLYLINSWGRNYDFYPNQNIKIPKCGPTQCYDLSKLDTSEITDMSNLFKYSKFNGDISNWDVSNVTDMRGMFGGAYNFNQALNKWDVSNVTDMSRMFEHTWEFNQTLDNWDVSNIIDMSRMFGYAKSFNQALNDWDVSNVTTMELMFQKAIAFNHALDKWDVSSVTNMHWLFAYAKEFNQALDKWKISNVRDMGGMFYNTIAFEKRFNNGNSLPEDTNDLKQWLKENRDKMLAIETLNKVSTPEQKIAIIENKISNNKTTLDDLFKEKNINPNSKVGLELLKVYNDTHDKLKLELEDLKTQVVDIATNDFNSL